MLFFFFLTILMVSLDYEVYVMARFKFKVYLENKIKFIELEEYQKKTLQEMDIICLEKESYYDLLDDLAYTSDISRSEIKKVYIYDSIKDNEFSIICGNSYIENIIREISNGKKVTETNSYLEMKNYLLDQLENDNYKTFLTEVYNYGNTFQGILSRYATSFHQGVYSEEESKNLQDLKSEILERLAKYKNYRGLAIFRKKKEENYFYIKKSVPKKNSLSVTTKMVTNPNYTLNRTFKTTLEKVEEYNQETEEYLDPEEYEMMYGEDDPKGIK